MARGLELLDRAKAVRDKAVSQARHGDCLAVDSKHVDPLLREPFSRPCSPVRGEIGIVRGNRPTGCVRPSPSYPWPPPADDEQRKVVLEHEVEWAPALRAAVVRPGSRLIDVAIRCLDGATVPVGELLSRGDVNARLGR